MFTLEDLGLNIKVMRNKKGMTQKSLSRLIGVRPETISLIENGKSNFKIKTLFKLAEALNCKIHNFCPSNNEVSSFDKFLIFLTETYKKYKSEES